MSVTLSTSAKLATTNGNPSSTTGSLNGRVVARLSEEEKTSLVSDFVLSKEKTKIGEGNHSKVYSWSHKGKTYAVKPCDKDSLLAEREARIGPLLSHPNLVVHHGFGGERHLIMDYAKGQDFSFKLLQDHFSIEGCDKSDQLRRWNNSKLLIAQLRDAISYMHDNCYMHRDIQLGNIRVVMKAGKLEHATLIDLGFVRHTDTVDGLPPKEETKKRQRIRYTYCGAICNMSPQVEAGEDYTEKADVWSLGCLLHYLLLGKFYFQVQHKSTFDDCLPEVAKELLGKLLSKKEKDRPFLSEIVNHPFFTTEAPEFPKIMSDRN